MKPEKAGKITLVYSGLISFGVLVTVFLAVFGQKVRNLLLGMFA